jgi:hypothetical protein
VETTAEARHGGRREHAARERALVPIRYALLRLRRNAPRTLTVALGIAVGAAMLALTTVAATAVQDRAVQRALARLEPSDRAVQAVWSGVPAQSDLSYAQLDRLARGALTPVVGSAPFAVVVFRQATWGGAFVNLGAVDGLARRVDLVSGSLPRPCTPVRCELVQIGGAPVAPKLPFLHVVGRADFRPGAPLDAYFGRSGGRRPPILLANGAAAFTRVPLPDAPLVARTYGWVVPVAPRDVHDWQLARLDARLDHAQSQLERRSDIFTVAAPTDTIDAIRATSRVASQRLLVLGGDAAVLLLGFAILASTRLRRDHRAVRRRLTWAGARRTQLLLLASTEALAITAVATAAGWLAGSAGGALLARHLGAPGGEVVAHAILTWRTLVVALALAALTAVGMLAALRVDALSLGGLRVTVADAAALGALAAVLLALARGKADAASLHDDAGTGVLLLLLPALVLFVLAVAAARLLAPVLRLLERAARRTRPAFRIALLSLARAPGEVALTVVFFVLAVGIAVFAVAYRATLVQGEREQARFAVPAPFVLQEDLTKLVTVQEARLPRGYAASPVLREAGSTGGSRGRDFTLLALRPDALARIGGWRSDFSSQSPPELARMLAPADPPRLAGIRLGRTLTLPFATTGDVVGVSAVVENPRGDFTPVDLGEHGAGRHTATVTLPPQSRGGRLVAIRLSFPTIASYVAGHRSAETSLSVDDASTGTISLDRRFDGWLGTGRFTVNNADDAIVRPREPHEGELVPVVASPAIARTAGPSGIVTLRAENQVIAAKVVATTRFFPSVDGDVVVADLPTWLAAANTHDPGVAVPSELWADRAPPRTTSLAVSSQRALERDLAGDPLARGAIALLLVTAAVGLALAAIGLVLTVLGDARDERGALFDLSAQGATPRELRRHVLTRAAVVGVLGLAGGVAAGAIVSALVVAVVTVSASAADALPPLALRLDLAIAASALAVLIVASAGVAYATARRAL